MIRLVALLFALLLATGTGSYYYIKSLKDDIKVEQTNNTKLQAALLIEKDTLNQVQKESEQQLNAVLDSYTALEQKYDENQKKRRMLLNDIEEAKKQFINAKSSDDLSSIVNDGSNILLNRIEELTNNYYSSSTNKDKGKADSEVTKAETTNNEEDSLEGIFE